VVDGGGGLTTTSTICSHPLVVPQEGLSREMTLSPPPSAAAVAATYCAAGSRAVVLVVRGVLGRTLEALRSKSIGEIFAPNALVEGAELLVDAGSKGASAGTVCEGQQP
jgi:hypothetical protein